MNATKQGKSISAKKDTGECFSTKLKSTCKNSGTFKGKKISPKVTCIHLAPSHSITVFNCEVGHNFRFESPIS